MSSKKQKAMGLPIPTVGSTTSKANPPNEISSKSQKWKIENREKNRKLEKDRKDRVIKTIELLRNLLPAHYVEDCCDKIKGRTPGMKHKVPETDKLPKIPQYLILEAIHSYILSLQYQRNFELDRAKLSAQKDFSAQTLPESTKKLVDQNTQTIVNTVENLTQTLATELKFRSTQTDVFQLRVTESPSKNRFFNINSLISDNNSDSPSKKITEPLKIPTRSIPNILPVHDTSKPVTNKNTISVQKTTTAKIILVKKLTPVSVTTNYIVLFCDISGI